MTFRPVYLTPEGKQALEAELERLAAQRQELLQRIQEEREVGSFSETSEPDSDRNDLAFVEGRMQTIDLQLRTAQMIPVDVDRTVVGLGSRVEVEDDDGETDSYMIVGTPEANPSQGKISNESPVGRALIGLRVGEVATVATPSGQMRYTVRKIH